MADGADHGRIVSIHPSPARVYDYFLGGSLNNAIDRRLGQDLTGACPALPQIARHQRLFLRHALHHMIGLGVHQFLELGSGLPTAGHAHHIAHASDPDIRVAYVDNDPEVVADGAVILSSTPNVAIVHADIRRPTDVLQHDSIASLIDPAKPLGITMVGILEFIPDRDNPAALLAAYRNATQADTYIALTIVSNDDNVEVSRQFANAAEIYSTVGAELTARPPSALHRWLAGSPVVAPGVTRAAIWPAGSQPASSPESDTELTLAAIVTA